MFLAAGRRQFLQNTEPSAHSVWNLKHFGSFQCFHFHFTHCLHILQADACATWAGWTGTAAPAVNISVGTRSERLNSPATLTPFSEYIVFSSFCCFKISDSGKSAAVCVCSYLKWTLGITVEKLGVNFFPLSRGHNHEIIFSFCELRWLLFDTRTQEAQCPEISQVQCSDRKCCDRSDAVIPPQETGAAAVCLLGSGLWTDPGPHYDPKAAELS